MALRLLRGHEAELKRLGVVRLFLFGSTTQDQARDGSDMGALAGHLRAGLPRRSHAEWQDT
jgi:predicted nucleotidyltransferase